MAVTGSDRQAEEKGIYLDHAATSPLRAEVWHAMEGALDDAYNPASSHAFGREAHRCLEDGRRRLAEALGCRRNELYLTAGGTQSDNLAVLGFARAHRDDGPRILTSAVEHKAVLRAADAAEREGAEVRRLPVDGTGTLELDALESALAAGNGRPTLVSVMWANNEVGTVQPVAEAARLAHAHGATFHTDAVQALGKVDVALEGTPIDLLTATAHKLGGPVGIGLLFRRGGDEGVPLEPLTWGGAQERSLWPGTQNPMGAVGFAEAARLAVEDREEKAEAWRRMRDDLAGRLLDAVDGVRIHGAGAPARLPHLVSAGVPGCDAGALLVFLDMEGVALSAGSACGSGSMETSHVLRAMGLVRDEAYATLRFTFGPDTTPREVERAAAATIRACRRVRETAAVG